MFLLGCYKTKDVFTFLYVWGECRGWNVWGNIQQKIEGLKIEHKENTLKMRVAHHKRHFFLYPTSESGGGGESAES